VVHLTDTAGLRETEEVIEREGIKRAVARSKEGHMSLFVVDATA
jgi:tRNA modification GTPase